MVQDRTRKIVITGVLSAISIFLGVTRLGFIPWITGASLTIMHVPVIIGAVVEGPLVGLVIGLIFGVFSLIQAAVAPTGPTDVIFTNPLISVLPRLLIGPAAWLVYLFFKRIRKSIFISISVIGIFAIGILWQLSRTTFTYIQKWVSSEVTAAVIVTSVTIILFELVIWFLYFLAKRKEDETLIAIIAAGIGGSLTNTVLVLGMIGVLGFLRWAALPPIILGNGLVEAAASAVLVLAVVSIWQQIGHRDEHEGAEF